MGSVPHIFRYLSSSGLKFHLKIELAAERPEQRNKLLTCEFLQMNLTLKAQLGNFVWNLGDVIKGLNYDVIVTSSESKMPFFGTKIVINLVGESAYI